MRAPFVPRVHALDARRQVNRGGTSVNEGAGGARHERPRATCPGEGGGHCLPGDALIELDLGFRLYDDVPVRQRPTRAGDQRRLCKLADAVHLENRWRLPALLSHASISTLSDPRGTALIPPASMMFRLLVNQLDPFRRNSEVRRAC